jgi:hypothetical protein
LAAAAALLGLAWLGCLAWRCGQSQSQSLLLTVVVQNTLDSDTLGRMLEFAAVIIASLLSSSESFHFTGRGISRIHNLPTETQTYHRNIEISNYISRKVSNLIDFSDILSSQ